MQFNLYWIYMVGGLRTEISNWSLLGSGPAKGRELHALTAFSLFCFSSTSYPINLLRPCLQLRLAITTWSNNYLILFYSGKRDNGVVLMGLKGLKIGLEKQEPPWWSENQRSYQKLYFSRWNSYFLVNMRFVNYVKRMPISSQDLIQGRPLC